MVLNPFDDLMNAKRLKVGVTYAVLLGGNVAAWICAWLAFRDSPVLLGTAFLAYSFGLRHAFDADHIAAIDNVVRKLMRDERYPFSVGFFFSLGHSTIVVLAAIVIVATAEAMKKSLDQFHDLGGIIGTLVSAAFLLTIGVANLFILCGLWAAFKRVRAGERISADELDTLLTGRGFLSRLLQPVFRVVSRSWHMYAIGFLFGLGFDTATEIGLLGISATQAASGLSFWSILVFPTLFTAGMALMDTTDSVLMSGAYGWAFVKPARKLWYNLTITATSVAIAFFIGGLEALNLMGDKLGLTGFFWTGVGKLNDDLANFGFVVVGIFLTSWAVSTAVYKSKKYDMLEVS